LPWERFEQLPVWNVAIRLAEGVFDLTESPALTGHSGLRDQLERAVLSISNNIAEGWERGTHEELLTFLYYARGAAGEVRSMLEFLTRRDRPGLGRDVEPLLETASDVSKQLGAWLESLKNRAGTGQRYRNDSTRQAEALARRQNAFLEKLRDIQDKAKSSDRQVEE
jgi:four helix bundle protein